MDKYNGRSRINKFNKRRRNTKMITVLLVVGSLLGLLLISVLLLGNENGGQTSDLEKGDKHPIEKDNNHKDLIISEPANDDNEKHETEQEDEENTSENEDLSTEQVESSDESVVEAFKADWQPIGTSQSEPHTVDYNANSKDRDEMKKAIQVATGLDDMTFWWIGNDGEQKVVATVSDSENLQTYRVYLSWETNRGWQPTLVEVLKENDKR